MIQLDGYSPRLQRGQADPGDGRHHAGLQLRTRGREVRQGGRLLAVENEMLRIAKQETEKLLNRSNAKQRLKTRKIFLIQS